jgi:CheY-like chemotaxis protein
MVNLLSNAARLTEKGGIRVHAAAYDEHITISVTDTGPGIPPDDAKRLFEPFSQGWHQRTSEETGAGSGLGLSISKSFVELHNGRIWLESEVGVGSTFSFRLPVGPLPVLEAAPERWFSKNWEWIRRSSHADVPAARLEQRVIVCDRTGEVRRSFARHSDDVEYVSAGDLEQVINVLSECPAQAVVLNAPSPDELWPLVDRARTRMPDVPIVGCSVRASVEQALTAGAAGYLLKPVTRAALQDAIELPGVQLTHVAVADDDPDASQLLVALLHTCSPGLEITTASNGREALDLLRSREPDLMLLDILMPEMNGWQVLSVKNREPAIAEIPVILVTAQDPREQPLLSQVVMAAMGEGMPIGKLVRCSQLLSMLLMQPD